VWQAHSRKISYTTQASITLAQIYNTDRSLAIKRLPQLCRFIDKQRSNADYYSRNLSIAADMLDREEQNLFSNRLQYPLVTPGSEECERLAKRLHESRISTARPYKDIVKIAARHYEYTGDCPQAERIARTVLVIPCNYALNATELQHIATCVNQVWEEINDRRTVGDVPPVSAHRSIPRRYSKRVAQ
jgi:dTDP-4-amino-4,6-dideoxygalactose transaminase